MFDHEVITALGISLGIGLLIGLERGWRQRDQPEGGRVAGLRTFGVIGLLGGCLAVVANILGEWVLGLGFVALAIIIASAYIRRSIVKADIGITSAMTALLTFVLGALPPLGHPAPAAASAVIAVILLSFKPTLHGWVAMLDEREFTATLKLLFISVVLLPVLPNRTMGPWDVLNPFEIWWMVVLIAAISYVGYFSMKILGPAHGAVATGIFGGLAASTAVTLSLSRLARHNPGAGNALTAGILASSAITYVRVIAIASIIEPPLLTTLAPPLAIMAVTTFAIALIFWRLAGTTPSANNVNVQNPFQLSSALRFAAFLVVVMLASKFVVGRYPETGLYVLAAISGAADLDAITLSLARMSAGDLPHFTAAVGVVIAVAASAASKTTIAFVLGGAAFGVRVAPGFAAPVLLGLAYIAAF